uniref:Complex 1 LYR protein domain-containing protein n=2 Tax=Monodon monoceros TaxID=40151 RepID=A0A8C6BDR3_MONMO
PGNAEQPGVSGEPQPSTARKHRPPAPAAQPSPPLGRSARRCPQYPAAGAAAENTSRRRRPLSCPKPACAATRGRSSPGPGRRPLPAPSPARVSRSRFPRWRKFRESRLIRDLGGEDPPPPGFFRSKMAASSRAQVLDLYRTMLRESKHFSAYSYRSYAIRRIRDAFRENKNVKDPVQIQALVNKAKRDLGIIRRQVHIGQMYSTDKLIIENQEKPRT